MEQLTRQEIRGILVPRDTNAHKKMFGKLGIIAGSLGMAGAAILCGKAALRSGVGLATFFAEEEILPVLQSACYEVMAKRRDLVDTPDALREQGFTAVCVGPGIGTGGLTDSLFFAALYQNLSIPIVLDADGINDLRRWDLLDDFIDMQVPKIITPHEGEAARLMKEQAIGDREKAAKRLAKGIKGIAVLKGPGTLIADEAGNLWQNTTGNVALATGGTGDVLAGMIGSFLAQGMSALDAAKAGVYLHGLAGDMACERYGTYGTTASDLLAEIPRAILTVMNEDVTNA